MSILLAISFSHLLNDMMQSLIPAMYPMLKSSYQLSFAQIGLLTFTYQITASLLQPVIGWLHRSQTQALLPGGGHGLHAVRPAAARGRRTVSALLLIAAALVGTGSSVFHPESSRVARMASGGAHGLAQSIFQVGGNVGSAIGPLLAAFIVLPLGQKSVAWFGSVGAAGHRGADPGGALGA